jgi:hypothetical protein
MPSRANAQAGDLGAAAYVFADKSLFNTGCNLSHVLPGWTITWQVAQSAQWDDEIVFDESNVFRTNAARWPYTAVALTGKRLRVII